MSLNGYFNGNKETPNPQQTPIWQCVYEGLQTPAIEPSYPELDDVNPSEDHDQQAPITVTERAQYAENMRQLILTARKQIHDLKYRVAQMEMALNGAVTTRCPACFAVFNARDTAFRPKYMKRNFSCAQARPATTEIFMCKLKVSRSKMSIELEFDTVESLCAWVSANNLDTNSDGLPTVFHIQKEPDLKNTGSLLPEAMSDVHLSPEKVKSALRPNNSGNEVAALNLKETVSSQQASNDSDAFKKPFDSKRPPKTPAPSASNENIHPVSNGQICANGHHPTKGGFRSSISAIDKDEHSPAPKSVRPDNCSKPSTSTFGDQITSKPTPSQEQEVGVRRNRDVTQNTTSANRDTRYSSSNEQNRFSIVDVNPPESQITVTRVSPSTNALEHRPTEISDPDVARSKQPLRRSPRKSVQAKSKSGAYTLQKVEVQPRNDGSLQVQSARRRLDISPSLTKKRSDHYEPPEVLQREKKLPKTVQSPAVTPKGIEQLSSVPENRSSSVDTRNTATDPVIIEKQANPVEFNKNNANPDERPQQHMLKENYEDLAAPQNISLSEGRPPVHHEVKPSSEKRVIVAPANSRCASIISDPVRSDSSEHGRTCPSRSPQRSMSVEASKSVNGDVQAQSPSGPGADNQPPERAKKKRKQSIVEKPEHLISPPPNPRRRLKDGSTATVSQLKDSFTTTASQPADVLDRILPSLSTCEKKTLKPQTERYPGSRPSTSSEPVEDNFEVEVPLNMNKRDPLGLNSSTSNRPPQNPNCDQKPAANRREKRKNARNSNSNPSRPIPNPSECRSSKRKRNDASSTQDSSNSSRRGRERCDRGDSESRNRTERGLSKNRVRSLPRKSYVPHLERKADTFLDLLPKYDADGRAIGRGRDRDGDMRASRDDKRSRSRNEDRRRDCRRRSSRSRSRSRFRHSRTDKRYNSPRSETRRETRADLSESRSSSSKEKTHDFERQHEASASGSGSRTEESISPASKRSRTISDDRDVFPSSSRENQNGDTPTTEPLSSCRLVIDDDFFDLETPRPSATSSRSHNVNSLNYEGSRSDNSILQASTCERTCASEETEEGEIVSDQEEGMSDGEIVEEPMQTTTNIQNTSYCEKEQQERPPLLDHNVTQQYKEHRGCQLENSSAVGRTETSKAEETEQRIQETVPSANSYICPELVSDLNHEKKVTDTIVDTVESEDDEEVDDHEKKTTSAEANDTHDIEEAELVEVDDADYGSDDSDNEDFGEHGGSGTGADLGESQYGHVEMVNSAGPIEAASESDLGSVDDFCVVENEDDILSDSFEGEEIDEVDNDD